MASISEFESEYIFPADFCQIPVSAAGQNAVSAMWDEGNFHFYSDGTGNMMKPAMDTLSSVSGTSSFPKGVGVPAMGMAEVALPEFDKVWPGIGGVQSYQTGYPQDVNDFGEKFSGFTSNFQPVYVAGDVQTFQESPLPKEEGPSLKAYRYSEEERKDKILRYLKKRNQRNFNKTIKYACRKNLADRRVRVRGRFARNSERGEEATMIKNTNRHEQELLYYDEGPQMQDINGEDWLQEAVTSLMYLPYIS